MTISIGVLGPQEDVSESNRDEAVARVFFEEEDFVESQGWGVASYVDELELGNFFEVKDSVEVEPASPFDVDEEILEAVDRGDYDEERVEDTLEPYIEEEVRTKSDALSEVASQLHGIDITEVEDEDLRQDYQDLLESVDKKKRVEEEMPEVTPDVLALILQAPYAGHSLGTLRERQEILVDYASEKAYDLETLESAEEMGLIETQTLEHKKTNSVMFYKSTVSEEDRNQLLEYVNVDDE